MISGVLWGVDVEKRKKGSFPFDQKRARSVGERARSPRSLFREALTPPTALPVAVGAAAEGWGKELPAGSLLSLGDSCKGFW
jgi:hypothetical protein